MGVELQELLAQDFLIPQHYGHPRVGIPFFRGRKLADFFKIRFRQAK
jgi:hypothetical protein